MEKLLFDIEQISNYLSIKEKTIYKKVESGEIPHYKIGRLLRFKKEEIDKWLEACKQANKLEAGQQKIKKNRRKSSKLINNHFDKITANIIDEETSKYYHTDNGKSDLIEGLAEMEAANGNL